MPNIEPNQFLDLTVTIPTIIALCAIISPVLVAAINNRHQYKMKKLEIASGEKFSAIEKYLNATGKYLSYDNPHNFVSYGEAKGMVYLYIPKTSWKTIDKLDDLILKRELEKAQEFFSEVCKELSKAVKD